MQETDYLQDALDRLTHCAGKLTLELSDTKLAPLNGNDSNYRPHYRCTLTGPGGEYVFDFWDSIKAGEDGTEATVYDVMTCLDWHCAESFDNFCDESGYDKDSISAHKTWRARLAPTRSLRRVFPSEKARVRLSEIR